MEKLKVGLTLELVAGFVCVLVAIFILVFGAIYVKTTNAEFIFYDLVVFVLGIFFLCFGSVLLCVEIYHQYRLDVAMKAVQQFNQRMNIQPQSPFYAQRWNR